MNESQQTVDLDARVRSVWQRSQKLHVSSGFLALVRWGVVLFAVTVLVDWLVDLPSSLRVGMLFFILAVSSYQAWRAGWRSLRKFNAARAAMQMEDHEGGMESLLVTAIEFRESQLMPGTSPSLREVTCRRAEKAVAAVKPEKVIQYGALRRPISVILGLLLLVTTFGFYNGPFLAAGIARIFPPWMAVAYPTRTQLEVASDKIIVKEGMPAVIRALVSGRVPDQAKLELRTGEGEPRSHVLEIRDDQCEYAIEAAYRGFEYRIVAGDAKTSWYEVEVISSPTIKKAEVQLQYPAYTRRPAETVEALTVTVPEGTEVYWKLSLDRAVREASYVSASGGGEPLEISNNGLTVMMRAPASESRAYHFSWVEKEHGFAFNSSNHYLQVAPDEPPRVELTSPRKNLFATLGRRLELAFRGRDDHGIGDMEIAFRVNKIEEQKVAFTSINLGDGSEHRIDWDYRTALPDLEVGDTVSFAVELTDLYPGEEGAHRVRSQARSMTFLSRKDYLAQINKQKQRLLLKLRSIYREERKVHATVSMLDPAAGEFSQSCQLEAVRQELLRDQISGLRDRIQEILDDLAANSITDEAITGLLVKLQSDLQVIADEHVGRAAQKLRELRADAQMASDSNEISRAAAISSVDGAARELGCLVLQAGFREATEVMARELHAIAENQASIRMNCLLASARPASGVQVLADSQRELGQWVTRLFQTLPKDRESTIEDALIAFNLSRLIKGLRLAGVEPRMQEASELILRSDASGVGKVATIQAEIIKALLYAEFRLRVGSEYEALDKAGELFLRQVAEQEKLRDTIIGFTDDQFEKGRSELHQAQVFLQKQFYLLLMPAIPAARPELLDRTLPLPPPAERLLSQAESALKKALAHIKAGEREDVIIAQRESEKSFIALGEIIQERIDVLTEREQLFNLGLELGKYASEITELEERQLILIEKTEDVEGDDELVDLARLQEKLIRDIEKMRHRVEKRCLDGLKSSNELQPLLSDLKQFEATMRQSREALEEREIDDAIEHQEDVLIIFEDTTKLLADQLAKNSFLATSLNDTWTASLPGPYVAEIQAEQLDLVETTASAMREELPQLAIVQKNLIHAVNAVLGALDPLSHQIESGTVFLFAKDDMDAAAVAIEENDLEEAADAGSFVAESLGDLSKELGIVIPRYSYLLEINQFYHQAVSEIRLIHAEQELLRYRAIAGHDAALLDQQTALQERAEEYANRMLLGTGLKSYASTSDAMVSVLRTLKAGNQDAAVGQMERVEAALGADAEQIINLMELIANVLKPSPTPVVSPDAALVLEVLSVASDQRSLYWKTQDGEILVDEQNQLAKRCQQLLQRVGTHAGEQLSLPPEAGTDRDLGSLAQFLAIHQTYMVRANQLIADAAAKLQSGATPEAVTNQQEAGDLLRYFLIAYTNEFLTPPGPPSSSDPVITDPTESSLEDSLTMFMPGAVSGAKPKGGRQEWEVLGKRDRAALHENFARELPLEYRTILKDYYERLAK